MPAPRVTNTFRPTLEYAQNCVLYKALHTRLTAYRYTVHQDSVINRGTEYTTICKYKSLHMAFTDCTPKQSSSSITINLDSTDISKHKASAHKPLATPTCATPINSVNSRPRRLAKTPRRAKHKKNTQTITNESTKPRSLKTDPRPSSRRPPITPPNVSAQSPTRATPPRYHRRHACP